MKRLLLIVFLFPAVVFAQTDSLVKYSEVVTVTGVNKAELYQRARSWFNNTFKSSKDVLQIQDKEAGDLSGKGNLETYYTYRYLGERKVPIIVNFFINVYTKDDRYKYEMGNFKCEVKEPGNVMYLDLPVLTSSNVYPFKVKWSNEKKLNETWMQLKHNVDVNVKALIVSLDTAMNSKAANDF